MAQQKQVIKVSWRWLRWQGHQFDRDLRQVVHWLWRQVWRIQRTRPVVRPVARWSSLHYRLTAGLLAGLLLLSLGLPIYANYQRDQAYKLSQTAQSLLGLANPVLADKIKLNQQDQVYEFNGSSKKATTAAGQNPVAQLASQVGGNGAKDTQQYSVDIPRDLSKGVTYYDNTMGLSFTLAPQFSTQSGEAHDNRLVFPLTNGVAGQLVYTAQAAGLKEDIVLSKNPGVNQVVMQYKLQLPDSLAVRLIPETGEIGIYSADPALYGNISYGSSDDQAKVEQVRTKSEKNYLVFKMPAPYVVGMQNGIATRAALQSRFSLSQDTKTLSVITTGFNSVKAKAFPLSIDPSVTVSSTANFKTGNDEDNNTTYGTTAVTRQGLTGGVTGAYAATSAMLVRRYGSAAASYNGYIYMVGGADQNSSTQNTVEYAAINSDGTLGTWTATSTLVLSSVYLTAAVYNGYIYAIGGQHSGGVSITNVQYAPINSDGTLGTWASTTVLPLALSYVTSVTYNGFIYSFGGYDGTTRYTTVNYAPINADGTLGAWAATSSFTNGRDTAAAVYNGYVYIFGGHGNTGFTRLADVQYAPINADGTLGTWTATTSYTTATYGHRVVITGGYAYVYGGSTATSVYTANVQYAPINANGTLGTWSATTAANNAFIYSSMTAENGNIYICGGLDTSTSQSNVQFATVAAPGATGAYAANTSYTTTRRGSATVVYNNFLYVLGGDNGSTPINSIYRAAINPGGTLGSYTNTSVTAFTTVRTLFAAFVYNGYMYVIGGCSSIFTSCTTAANNVGTAYKAAIASNGNVGAWSSVTAPPTALYGASAIVYNGYVYLMGGINGSTYNATVWYSAIASSGNLGSWTTATGNALASARAYMSAVVYGGYIYIAGGCTAGTSNTCTAQLSEVRYARLNGSGGGFATSWTTASSFSVARYGLGLVASNGYLYITGGKSNLSNFYADTQAAVINTDGSLGSWLASNATLSTARWVGGAVAVNGQLYVTGGFNGTTYYNDTQSTPINNGGRGDTPTWATPTSSAAPAGMPTDAQMIAIGNYVYAISGDNSGGGAQTVWYIPLTAVGNFGTWVQTTSLNVARISAGGSFGLVTLNGYIYVLSGYTGSAEIASSEYAKINSDGSLGAWTIATGMLSIPSNQARDGMATVVYNGNILLIGGWGSAPTAEVDYMTPSAATGDFTTWTPTTSLPYVDYYPAATVYNGYVYVLGGGVNNTASYNSVLYAPINTNGTVGSWQYTSSFSGVQFTNVITQNGYMYIVGGNDGTNNLANVQRASINANGSLGNWDFTTNLSTAGWVDCLFVRNGYVYALNFMTGLSLYTSLSSTPRVTHYSKLINLGTAGVLTSITFNGTLADGNADITYRTAGSDGVFSTAVSNVSNLSYLASGSCAIGVNTVRYVLAMVTIDDSGNGIFQDSPTNNLTSLTVNSKPGRPTPDVRMRQGKYFSDKALQAYDTCSP